MYHEKDTEAAPLKVVASFLKIWSLIYEESKICVSMRKKNTDMTITEVAGTVGFSGSSYYAESFRKWCKKSPSEYRRQENMDK